MGETSTAVPDDMAVVERGLVRLDGETAHEVAAHAIDVMRRTERLSVIFGVATIPACTLVGSITPVSDVVIAGAVALFVLSVFVAVTARRVALRVLGDELRSLGCDAATTDTLGQAVNGALRAAGHRRKREWLIDTVAAELCRRTP